MHWASQPNNVRTGPLCRHQGRIGNQIGNQIDQSCWNAVLPLSRDYWLSQLLLRAGQWGCSTWPSQLLAHLKASHCPKDKRSRGSLALWVNYSVYWRKKREEVSSVLVYSWLRANRACWPEAKDVTRKGVCLLEFASTHSELELKFHFCDGSLSLCICNAVLGEFWLDSPLTETIFECRSFRFWQ